MAKVSLTSLKLKTKKDVSTFEFCGNTIEVLNYLPVEDKYDLISITAQKAEEDGIYNPLLLDMYFHLHMIYMYTNLSITPKQKEDEMKLYDILFSNGFLTKFLETIDEDEYMEVQDYLKALVSKKLTYKNTAASVLQTIIHDLPKNAAAAKDLVENFDKEKYQAVIDFATAANGGRNINTNE